MKLKLHSNQRIKLFLISDRIKASVVGKTINEIINIGYIGISYCMLLE